MKKVNLPSSQMWRYEGMWVAINPETDKIVAVGETLEEISEYVSSEKKDAAKIEAAAFKVPKKTEKNTVI